MLFAKIFIKVTELGRSPPFMVKNVGWKCYKTACIAEIYREMGLSHWEKVRKAHFTVNFSNASCFITFPTYILYHKMRGPSQLSHYNEDFCKQHYINTDMRRCSRSYAYYSLWPKMISYEPNPKIHAAAPQQKCSYLEITNKIRKFLSLDWPKV